MAKVSENNVAREVLKWIQSLDLTWQFKNAKWDLSNGYLVAEILSWYHPQDISIHNYSNGVSLEQKDKNWYLLKNFFKRKSMKIPEPFIDGTIHCREDAAVLLLECLYQLLTKRTVRKKWRYDNVDFTDENYQNTLPIHARSTASKAIKTNLKNTELVADSSHILAQKKSQAIIQRHVQHRIQERVEYPERFNIKPTLGEKCIRTGSSERAIDGSDTERIEESASREEPIPYETESSPTRENTDNTIYINSPDGPREPNVQFKEVKQSYVVQRTS